jgi:competence protein ComEC
MKICRKTSPIKPSTPNQYRFQHRIYSRLVICGLCLILTACAGGSVKSGTANPGTAASSSAVAVKHPLGLPRRPYQVATNAAPEAYQAGLPQSTADPTSMVAHFIDVGQGDATLLEFSCGAVLIDTGGEKTSEVSGREKLKEYLTAFFQRRADLAWTLDLVVLSHPHIDHTDGVEGLLEITPQVTIRNIVDNGEHTSGSGISGQKKLEQYATDSGAHYLGIAESDITTTSGLTNSTIDPVDCAGTGGVDPKFTAVWGHVDKSISWSSNANNDSVVMRVDFGKASFLFMGDLEEQAIKAMLESYQDDLTLLDVDVLKVGHHGSKNGTTPELVTAVTPQIAVIQAGDSTLSRAQFSAYSFGHPTQQAVKELLATPSGVTMTRPTKHVRVGIAGHNPVTNAAPRFTEMDINKAIYSNAWDGNVAVIAHKDGSLAVETEF